MDGDIPTRGGHLRALSFELEVMNRKHARNLACWLVAQRRGLPGGSMLSEVV